MWKRHRRLHAVGARQGKQNHLARERSFSAWVSFKRRSDFSRPRRVSDSASSSFCRLSITILQPGSQRQVQGCDFADHEQEQRSWQCLGCLGSALGRRLPFASVQARLFHIKCHHINTDSQWQRQTQRRRQTQRCADASYTRTNTERHAARACIGRMPFLYIVSTFLHQAKYRGRIEPRTQSLRSSN